MNAPLFPVFPARSATGDPRLGDQRAAEAKTGHPPSLDRTRAVSQAMSDRQAFKIPHPNWHTLSVWPILAWLPYVDTLLPALRAPSTQPVRVGPSTRSTTAARPRPVARSLTPATTIVSAPPRPVRGGRRTLQTQSRASSTGVAREGIVLIASSGPRGNPGRREPPHQQTPSHEQIEKVLLEYLSSNSFEGAVGRSVSPAPAWRRGPPTAKHRTGRRGCKRMLAGRCWCISGPGGAAGR